GDLEVESTPGRGSTFHLTVVLDRTPAAGVAAGTPPALAILCVDHNPYGRLLMNAIVTELGHRATFAADAEAALAALAADHHDVVLMDAALPGIDGYEATRRIRALPGQAGRVHVIGVVGQEDNDKGDVAAAVGMDAWLTKPVSPRMLADVLARVRKETVERD